MFRRFSWLAVLPALALLVSCTDRPQRPSISAPPASPRTDITVYTCDPARIAELALMLVPVPIEDPPLDLNGSTTTILSLTPTQLALAQSLVVKLAGVLADDRILAQLRDPGTPTKAAAIGELLNRLFVCVQLPPPGDIGSAYSPGGGAAVVGSGGGTLLTRDGTAAFVVPAGALTTDVLLTIAPLPGLAITKTCLPQGLSQYNQCYNFSVSPSTAFTLPVTLAMCTLADAGALYGTPTLDVHNRLRMASVDHVDPTKIVVYDRALTIPLLQCGNAKVVQATPGLGERVFGRRWTRLAGMAAKVTDALSPTVAYAFDGLGCTLQPPGLLTNFTTVDPLVYQTGFETADVPAWTTTGFWHSSTLANLRNTAYPTYVSLAPGDNSNGALPPPFAGTYALWYGQDATGNYAGPLVAGQPAKSGGTSVSSNSGVAVSPPISVPKTTNVVSLAFQSWFEIESVNPHGFDVMTVLVEDLADPTHTRTQVATVNPAADPLGGAAPIPFTSGGFNTPPVWGRINVDLSTYRGKTVLLYFSFGTGDTLYNGFRGWIVDNVAVSIPSTASLSPSMVPVNAIVAPATPSAPAGPRVWHP
ncbi:MAG: hypothetical protein NVS4B3_23910 [Gemmatimonadaceae bacterium]